MTDAQWETLRAEWEEGALPIATLALTYGVSESAIRMRAKRSAWGARRKPTAIVRETVRLPSEPAQSAQSPPSRVALVAFDRILQQALEHRKMVRIGRDASDRMMARVEALIDERMAGGRRLSLREEAIVARIVQQFASTIDTLIPLERKLMGVDDRDVPSEFDLLTQEQLAYLADVVRRAMS